MRVTADSSMLQSWRRPAKLFSDFNTLQFASVTGMVLLVIILLFMADTHPHHYRSIPVDMPKVLHPVSMRGVDREDAMKVVVTRNGQVFFANEQVPVAVLAMKIENRLQYPELERKVYIAADARARWGLVKLVLDAVRAAGISRVAILTDQRRTGALHM